MWSSAFIAIFCLGALTPATALRLTCHKQTKHSIILGGPGEGITCPGPQDPADHIFCCENYTPRAYCCDGSFLVGSINASQKTDSKIEDGSDGENDIPLLSDSKAEKRSIVVGLAKLVGILLGVAAFVIILCVVCCCCCPFCFCYKKRQRGEVIRTNTGELQPQPGQQPYPNQQGGGYYQIPQSGQPPAPVGQPYTVQQPAYPPPQPGYPAQPFSYPPQPGYSEAAPPPYPGPPTDSVVQQGPEPRKLAAEYQTQPAYNPSAP